MVDWGSSLAIARDAIKVAVAVLVIALMDLAIPQHIKDPQVAEGLYRGLEWATVSVIMVSSTLMGASASRSFERILGTVCGGWLAYGLATGSNNLYFLAFAAAVVTFVGFWVGNMYDIKYGIAKLFPQAFLIVIIGSRGGANSSLFSTAVSRISGICFGVVLYLAVSVVVFPSTASEKAMKKLAEGFEALEALNNILWDSNLLRALRHDDKDAAGSAGAVLVDVGESSASMRSIVEESLGGTEELTKQLDNLVAILRKFDDYLDFAKSEVYIGSTSFPGWQRHFCPTLKWLNSSYYNLPRAELTELRQCLRQTSRTICNVSIAVGEAPSLETVTRMRRHYTTALFQEICSSCIAAVQDLSAHYIMDRAVTAFAPSANLLRLLNALERFLEKSARHRLNYLRPFEWEYTGVNTATTHKAASVQTPNRKATNPTADEAMADSLHSSSAMSGSTAGASDGDLKSDIETPGHLQSSSEMPVSTARAANGNMNGDTSISAALLPETRARSGTGVVEGDAAAVAGKVGTTGATDVRSDHRVAARGVECAPDQIRRCQSGERGLTSADHAPKVTESMQREPERQASSKNQVVLMFQPSDEGFFAKVRFYTFEFLLARLAVDLCALHTALNKVLPKMPGSRLERLWPGFGQSSERRFLDLLCGTTLLDR